MTIHWRPVTSAVLIAFLFLQTFSRLFILADFYANQASIAQTLCVNKANPTLGCCGKCQLKKRLAEEDKGNKDADQSGRKADGNGSVLSSRSFYLAGFIHYSLVETRHYSLFDEGHPISRSSSCFHPPGC